MLKGKIVEKVWRHRSKEIGIQFTDGTRLFVDISEGGLELSIT
jgi:diphthamide synthase subunit DPH2